jgi:hypothetical protein
MPSRRSKKDSPAKLAGRMKRRWRVVLLRSKGEILGEVEAPDVASAKAAAAIQFDLDEIRRNRIIVQELRSTGWQSDAAAKMTKGTMADLKTLFSEEAAQCRRLAEIATEQGIKEKLLEMAARFQALADGDNNEQ